MFEYLDFALYEVSLAMIDFEILNLLVKKLNFNRKIKASYSYFKKLGIKTPDYTFFFGNFGQLKSKV